MKKQPPTEYAPPGWFPDPTGLQALRWWDGTQWSHQTRPLPGNEQGPPLPYQPQQSYGQPRQPSSRPDPQYGTPPGQPPYQGHPQYQQTPYEQPYQQAQSYGQQPGPPSGHRGRPARKSWPRRHKVLTVLGSLALILVIVGIASGKTKQAGNASAVATTMPIRTTIPTPTHHATTPRVVPAKAPVATQAATPPPAPTTRAPVSTTPKPTATAHAAAPPPPPATTPAGCRPRTNGGNCYEPGEYCRDADHGASGIAGDGEAITCEDNDGWRWEPS